MFSSLLRPSQQQEKFWNELHRLFAEGDYLSTLRQNRKTQNDIPFDWVCQALVVRKEVFRLMLEFWLRWIIFPAPVPILASCTLDTALSEAEHIAGNIGRRVAGETWMQPGISFGALLEAVRSSYGLDGFVGMDEITEAIAVLDKSCLLSEQEGNWYFTARNSILETRRRED